MMAAVANSTPAPVLGASALRGGGSAGGNKGSLADANKTVSKWNMKSHLAYSDVAHLGVDNVLFALVRDSMMPMQTTSA